MTFHQPVSSARFVCLFHQLLPRETSPVASDQKFQIPFASSSLQSIVEDRAPVETDVNHQTRSLAHSPYYSLAAENIISPSSRAQYQTLGMGRESIDRARFRKLTRLSFRFCFR